MLRAGVAVGAGLTALAVANDEGVTATACAQPGWDVYDPGHHYASVPAPCCNGQHSALWKNGDQYNWICPLPGCALPGWDIYDENMSYVFGVPAQCCDNALPVQHGAHMRCPWGKPRTFPFGCGVGSAGDWPFVGKLFSTKYQFNLTQQVLNAQAIVDQKPNSKQLWRYDWRASEHPYSPNKWTYLGMDWCNKGGTGVHPMANDPNSVGVMGWNEPNSDQQCGQNPSNDSAAVAEFVALASDFKAAGKLVIGPATTKQAGTWLDDWLAEFKRQGSTDLDYLAYHHYAECNSKPKTTQAMMYDEIEGELKKHIGLMNKYNALGFNIKGIWITEIGCQPDGGWVQPWHWAPGAAEDLMAAFMKLVDTYDVLKAWAWFPYAGFGPLWDVNPPYTKLTDLGKTYFGNCHQDRAPHTEDLSVVV